MSAREQATISAAGDLVALDVSTLNAAAVHLRGGDTAAAGANLTFEASLNSTNGTDGDWFAIQGARSNANTAESATGALALGAGAANPYGWRLNTASYAWVRARATAITSGQVVAIIQGSWYPVETIPVTPTHAVTGSGSFTIATPPGSAYSLTTAATTNAAVVKSSAANLFDLTLSNPTATAVVVKLYDKATAPTVGTDIPKVTIPVPAGAMVPVQFGQNGKRFTSGIGIAVTANAAATDTAAAVAGVQVHGTYI